MDTLRPWFLLNGHALVQSINDTSTTAKRQKRTGGTRAAAGLQQGPLMG